MGKQVTAEKQATVEPAAQSAAQQSKAGKAKDTFGVITAALPIIGACGTLFVWVTANFYVGDVEVACADKYDHMLVKVFDSKGRESQYHTPKFQVWPGTYHFEISADDGKAHHADATVEFHQKTAIPISLAVAAKADSEGTAKQAESEKKRSWWKFWKRSNNPE